MEGFSAAGDLLGAEQHTLRLVGSLDLKMLAYAGYDSDEEVAEEPAAKWAARESEDLSGLRKAKVEPVQLAPPQLDFSFFMRL